MRAELGNNVCFLCGGQHGWLLLLVFLTQSTSLSVSVKDSTPKADFRRSGVDFLA
jgi:hypothetical protein